MIYVTWQPESAEAGMYFLTKLDDGGRDLTTAQIMKIAKAVESIGEDEPYDICSIIKVTQNVEVIF